ncbi:hypothetical protein CALCODRAFT_502931 [Calocera cornea HHB12733]|uniref:Apple domain-containing protein n=1 Tax=Calocera cornea HHB12733 TaxID=1353952 RepID=A0A165D247_9BASI|nr:hypothetical protein CALCODRAFT_502931 [Calocera cornea HHB12733]
MFIRTALLSLASLCVMLATLATALVPNAVPRALRQVTRDDVVKRMALYPDGTWSANRAKRSDVSTLCMADQPGGGSCGCPYNVYCDSQPVLTVNELDTALVDSFADCLKACDSVFACWVAVWQKSTQLCSIYGQEEYATTFTGNDDYQSAVYDLDDSDCTGTGLGTCG